MDNLKNKLSELLENPTWTEADRTWIKDYLKNPDSMELQDLMQQQFNNDQVQPKVYPDLSQHMLQEIHKRLGIEKQRKASVAGMWTWRIAIAASVLLCIGVAWKFFADSKQEIPVARAPKKKTDNVQLAVRHEINTTGREKRIQLPDSSLIVLADRSEIMYREPFTGARDITLTGKAYFKVAKDKKRPFTVTSGAISTTALGTAFTITAFKNTRQIIVRLYEGKVVLKAVDKTNRQMKRAIYLLPGQQFVYGGQTAAKVLPFPLTQNAAPEQIIHQELSFEDPSLPQNTDVSWYMFNNEPLEQVLEDLAALYNAEIVYNKKDVQHIYFTGKYNSADSVEPILKRICTLHNLTISRKDKVFTITR